MIIQNSMKDDKTFFWLNFEILSDIINKNIDILFEIQIHQNVNLNLINQVIVRYSAI